MKILACITAQVAVLQHSWLRHSGCNTATRAVIHARIFNTWLLILKYLYYLFIHNIPKKQSIFQCWTLLINTECSRIFQCMVCINKYGIFQVLIFLKNCVFLHKIMHQTQIFKKINTWNILYLLMQTMHCKIREHCVLMRRGQHFGI